MGIADIDFSIPSTLISFIENAMFHRSALHLQCILGLFDSCIPAQTLCQRNICLYSQSNVFSKIVLCMQYKYINTRVEAHVTTLPKKTAFIFFKVFLIFKALYILLLLNEWERCVQFFSLVFLLMLKGRKKLYSFVYLDII